MDNNTMEKRYGLPTAISMVIGIVIGSGIFIKGGKVLSSTDVLTFRESYRLVSGDREHLEVRRPKLIGCKEHAFGFTGLIRAEDAPAFAACQIAPADLESIMIYTEQEDGHEEPAL
jgi:hypothetical protein